jgi:hypothetical protein
MPHFKLFLIATSIPQPTKCATLLVGIALVACTAAHRPEVSRAGFLSEHVQFDPANLYCLRRASATALNKVDTRASVREIMSN